MLKTTPPNPTYISQYIIQALCPHCNTVSTLTAVSPPSAGVASSRALKEVIAGYACDHCNRAIPIIWEVMRCDSGGIFVGYPKEVISVREPFEFAHVPEIVRNDIEEALNCLSVRSFNGFAAMCRRTIQATCQYLGVGGSTKVEKQINELNELAELDPETFSSLRSIMLGGHDGAHPQLPAVDLDRAALLLQLLKDVTYQLFTRPGLVKEAAAKRAAAVQKKAEA